MYSSGRACSQTTKQVVSRVFSNFESVTILPPVSSTLLEQQANLVIPVDVVRRIGDQARVQRILCIQLPANQFFGVLYTLVVAEETGFEPRESVRHA